MNHYLDTSVLVSAMTAEAASPRVQLWLKQQDTGTLQISYWSTAEFSSALSLKIRTGQISLAQRADALATFAELKKRSLDLLRVARRHFDLAARLADDSSLGLRASTRCISQFRWMRIRHCARLTRSWPAPPPQSAPRC